MSKKEVNTDQAPSAIGPYSQGIKAGDFLFVSGQIPFNQAKKELVTGSIVDQAHQVMKNLQAILTAAGTDFSQVVKTTIFLKDLSHFEQVNEVYGSYFNKPYPARACVQVAKLPRDVGVEIDAIVKISN